MQQPLVPESDWWAYIATGLAALGASIARAGRWIGVDGKFSPSLFASELAIAGVIACMAVGGGVYWGWSLPVCVGLAAFGGLLGPATIIGSFQTFFKNRFGGATKSGGD